MQAYMYVCTHDFPVILLTLQIPLLTLPNEHKACWENPPTTANLLGVHDLDVQV